MVVSSALKEGHCSQRDRGTRLGEQMSNEAQIRPSSVELHRIARERLLDRDQRYTANRRQIVDALALVERPLTLPELIEVSPSLAQSSAYRNLSIMEEAGVVRRLVHGSEHAHFELAEDLTEHHHHLICELCGMICDITLDPATEERLDQAFDDLATAAGFTPRHHNIDVYGICADCGSAS
jgi:Fur family transcriptional regulator, ferric uptake regulator